MKKGVVKTLLLFVHYSITVFRKGPIEYEVMRKEMNTVTGERKGEQQEGIYS